MSEEQIKNILDSINYEVETDKNWIEPIGLDRDAWKALLKYIQQKENIIKEVREKLNTQIIETVSAQFNYECATYLIEQAKQILDKEVN